MQITKIIKQAIRRLEREGKQLTPDFYTEAFCKEAKNAGVKLSDCDHVEKLVQMLSPELQKELKNYRIHTLSEFSRYLVGKLNRIDKNKCSEQLDLQNNLMRSILKTISILHNLQAKELAKKTLETLTANATKAELEYIKQLWENFAKSYDDTFLQKLKPFGIVDTTDLKKTITNLHIPSKQNRSDTELQKIVSLLVTSLNPSISYKINQKIKTLAKKLLKDPQLILDDSVEKEIREMIEKRVELDRESVQEMVHSLEGVLDKLSKRLITMIEHSDGSTTEIQRIKNELKSILKEKESAANFQLAHKKLYTIAIALEKSAVGFKSDLEGHSDEVAYLQQKVQMLENELKKARAEAKIDFLTQLYNKRALDEFLKLREGEFKRYGRNYTIVMLDIDHFKKVNDTYGHEAGDIILKSFASIIKSDSRDIDIVGRFGGEEFMVILGNTDLEDGIAYAKKVNEHVKRAKFLYKEQRIPITVSIGVAQRIDNPSLEATIESADKNLYKAKNSGRDRVVGE